MMQHFQGLIQHALKVWVSFKETETKQLFKIVFLPSVSLPDDPTLVSFSVAVLN